MNRQVTNLLRTGNWKIFFTVVLIAQLSLFVSPVFACEPLVEEFCVDFYQGINLDEKPRLRGKTFKIKYDWGLRRPGNRVPHDNFSAQWRGKFEFKKGAYEFRVHADEGIRLLIDGQPVIDHWQDGKGVAYSAKIPLDAGMHLIEVEYFDGAGNAYLEVDWQLIPLATTLSENKAPIGVNLTYFSHSSSAVPFKDLIIQSGFRGIVKKKSKEPCPQMPPLDATGYPLYLPSGCVFRLVSALHILNDKYWPEGTLPYQPGRYVLLYKGSGQIKLRWDAKNVEKITKGRIEFDVPNPAGGIWIEVTESHKEDPIRDLHMVHIDDEATFRTQPFNDKWLTLLKPFSAIRLSAWGRVSDRIKVYSGSALSHNSTSITLPDSASAESGVFDDTVAMVNVDGKWPRVMIDRYDGDTRTLHLKTPIETSKRGMQPTVYIFDYFNRVWSDRGQGSDLEQTSSKGIAFETMIQLANILNINPWITIPTAADDDFVEQLAVLIKTKLKPHLKCYIEYSNETWNSKFPSYHYSEAKVKELQLSGTLREPDAWQAYRAVEIFRIFNRVFGEQDLRENRAESRLVRILTSQPAWLARGLRVMDWVMPNKAWPTEGEPAFKYADAWAITTYFYLKSNEILEQASMGELMTEQLKSVDAMFGSAEKPGIIRQTLTEVNERGMQLVTYEGGTHLLAPKKKQDLIAKLADVNKNPGMEKVYKRLLNHWDSLYQEFGSNKVGVWNHYSDVGRYGKNGYWGLMQSTYQDPLTAPKYQAIKEYASDYQ